MRQIGAVCIAAVALGSTAQTTSAQEPGTPAPEPTLPAPADGTSDTVPDDTGIVHSWGVAPGDGSLEAGQRPYLTYEIAPGGHVGDSITIFNYGNEQLTFRVYATDAFNNDDGSFNLLSGDQDPADVGTWVTMPVDAVTIPPRKQATIPLTVDVPVDATPGDHVGAILASSATIGTGEDNAVITLDRRTGTRLYVRVAGQLHPELAVEDLHTTYSHSINPLSGDAAVTYTIVNRGNVRLDGTQQVKTSGLFGMSGTSLDAEEIPELLPGESASFTKLLSGVAASGVLYTEVELVPTSPAGADEIASAGKRISQMVLPYLVLALILLLILARLARRSYTRHRQARTVDRAPRPAVAARDDVEVLIPEIVEDRVR
jgi:hypothetical protein